MLQAALESEVEAFLEQHAGRVDDQGRRHVVRNGHLPSREIVTGAGPLEVSQPRVRDKSADAADRVRFSSSILPPYLRKSKSIEELIPWLYLKGLSTGVFSAALQSLIGPDAGGFSANVVVRLKETWSQEYEAWRKRDLTAKQYVYVWADGIDANVRLEDEANSRQCLLVLMGATADGDKELIAVIDGYRESKQSWLELLLDLKQRGLTVDPKLAIGDGPLGFWAALREVFTTTRQQRCWVHKTANVLNKLPKGIQPKAKADLHEIWQAETHQMGHKAFGSLPGKVRRQVPRCLRMPQERSGCVVDVLRLPGGTLGTSASNEPHRKHLRHNPAQTSPNKGQWNQEGQSACKGRRLPVVSFNLTTIRQ